MPAPELQGLVDAAAEAAAAGDHLSAERLLNELAEKQEARLGPRHPALASTLNNLGVVCEALGRPDEAERHFRRACAIATAILPPDHPFVATSRKNLEDLCKAHGRAADLPVPPPPTTTPAAEAGPPAAPPPTAEPDVSPARAGSSPSAEPGHAGARGSSAVRQWSRGLLIAILVAVGVVAAFVASGTWFRADRSMERQPAGEAPAAGPATAAAPAPKTDAAPAAPADRPPAGSGPPAAAAPSAQSPPAQTKAPLASPPVEAAPAHPTPGAPVPVVVTAELCRELSKGGAAWDCVPPESPVVSGTIYFYTRLKSPVSTTVQHRWYHGDQLRMVVTLRVGVNTSSGWRTDSRITLPEGGGGDWRVELRSRAGVVLDEERFTVRRPPVPGVRPTASPAVGPLRVRTPQRWRPPADHRETPPSSASSGRRRQTPPGPVA